MLTRRLAQMERDHGKALAAREATIANLQVAAAQQDAEHKITRLEREQLRLENSAKQQKIEALREVGWRRKGAALRMLAHSLDARLQAALVDAAITGSPAPAAAVVAPDTQERVAPPGAGSEAAAATVPADVAAADELSALPEEREGYKWHSLGGEELQKVLNPCTPLRRWPC